MSQDTKRISRIRVTLQMLHEAIRCARFYDEVEKMVATSLLELDMDEILGKVKRLTNVKFPRTVIEVSLEPTLKVLCIRFKKPVKAELGEPLRHGIHLFTDRDTEEITAVEIVDLERL